MNDKILMTKQGVIDNREKLNYLINVERPQVIEELKAARAQGDLSENAEYDAAREKQANLEEKIKELTYLLDHYTLIEESGSTNKVSLGSTVTLFDYDENEEKTYTIVGSFETDIDKNEISNDSPLARKIEGKKVNDEVLIETSNFSYKVKILKIGKNKD